MCLQEYGYFVEYRSKSFHISIRAVVYKLHPIVLGSLHEISVFTRRPLLENSKGSRIENTPISVPQSLSMTKSDKIFVSLKLFHLSSLKYRNRKKVNLF